MAQLNGPLDITGRIAGLIIFTDKNGKTIVKGSSGPSSKKVKTSSSFQMLRLHSSEHGRASSAGCGLRIGLREIKEFCSSSNMHYRMTSCLKRVLKTDLTSALGQRLISAGNPAPMEDFEWNDKLSLDQALQADFSGGIDPATGGASLIVSSFVPSIHVSGPEGATHFELIAVAAAWHPEEKRVTSQFQRSGLKPLNARSIKAQTFQFDPLQSDHPILFVGLGIRFFTQVGEKSTALKGGAFRVLKAVNKS